MQPGDNGSARYTVVEEGELVTGLAPQSGRRLGTRWRRRLLQLQLRRRWLGSAGRGAAWRETPSQWWLLEGLVGAWGCICAAHRTKPQDAHIAGSVSRIVFGTTGAVAAIESAEGGEMCGSLLGSRHTLNIHASRHGSAVLGSRLVRRHHHARVSGDT